MDGTLHTVALASAARTPLAGVASAGGHSAERQRKLPCLWWSATAVQVIISARMTENGLPARDARSLWARSPGCYNGATKTVSPHPHRNASHPTLTPS